MYCDTVSAQNATVDSVHKYAAVMSTSNEYRSETITSNRLKPASAKHRSLVIRRHGENTSKESTTVKTSAKVPYHRELVCINERYCFHLTGKEVTSKLLLSEWAPVPISDGSLPDSSIQTYKNCSKDGVTVFKLGISFEPGNPSKPGHEMLELFDPKKFERSPDGKWTVTVDSATTVVEMTETPAELRIDSHVRSTYPEGNSIKTSVAKFRLENNGVRRTLQNAEKSFDTQGKLVEDTETEINTLYSTQPLKPDDFRLTAYGLPEPPGIEWGSRGVPVYVWALIVGVVCVLLFSLLRYRRTKTT